MPTDKCQVSGEKKRTKKSATFLTTPPPPICALPLSHAPHTPTNMGPKIEEIEDDLPPLEDVDEASTADSNGDAKVRPSSGIRSRSGD